jgi:hypothetical protein
MAPEQSSLTSKVQVKTTADGTTGHQHWFLPAMPTTLPRPQLWLRQFVKAATKAWGVRCQQ